jgi:F0F1-type ATP synthase delta subunit
MKMLNASKMKFVCLDDITGHPCQMNHVIYNPVLSKARNEEIIKKVCEEHLRLKLTDEQLDELTVYDENHLDEFIYHLQRIWYKK